MPISLAYLNANVHPVLFAAVRPLWRIIARARAESELSCIDERLLLDAGLTRERYLAKALQGSNMPMQRIEPEGAFLAEFMQK